MRSVSSRKSLRVPLSQAYGVVTFYHYFSLKPPGKHTMTICTGTACYIKGTDKLVAAAEKHLGIPQGPDHQGRQDQPDDGALRGRLRTRTGGADRRRTAGPDVRRADARAAGKVGGRMTHRRTGTDRRIAFAQRTRSIDHEINVCMGTGCLSQHSDKLKDALTKAVESLRQESSGAPHRLHGTMRRRSAGSG